MKTFLLRVYVAASLFLAGALTAKHNEFVQRQLGIPHCDCARHCPCHPCR